MRGGPEGPPYFKTRMGVCRDIHLPIPLLVYSLLASAAPFSHFPVHGPTAHVLEIYGLTAEAKTSHIEAFLEKVRHACKRCPPSPHMASSLPSSHIDLIPLIMCEHHHGDSKSSTPCRPLRGPPPFLPAPASGVGPVWRGARQGAPAAALGG